MQILVQAQGEALENVEKNLQDTENYLEKAEGHIEEAEEIQKGNQKKTFCLICCMLVVGLIFIILVSGLIPFWLIKGELETTFRELSDINKEISYVLTEFLKNANQNNKWKSNKSTL